MLHLLYLTLNCYSYGVYCDRKNNNKACHDYKYRLCCSIEKSPYGKWGKWSGCEGDCGPEMAFKTRTRKCYKQRPNCKEIDGTLVMEDKEPCSIPCIGIRHTTFF